MRVRYILDQSTGPKFQVWQMRDFRSPCLRGWLSVADDGTWTAQLAIRDKKEASGWARRADAAKWLMQADAAA